ncbi:phage terminase large subunit family protein [Bradyrhizobium elkanii]
MLDDALARTMLRALMPLPRISPSEFAERELRLPASSNALPGPLRLRTFQREIVDAIRDDDVETIVIMAGSQVGKSLAVEAQMMAMIATSPGPFMCLLPDTTAAEKMVRTRFDPFVESSPILKSLIGRAHVSRKGSTGGANSLSAKEFPGGSLTLSSSHKPSELAAQSVRCVWIDEADRCSHSAGKEGDPVLLAIQRTERWGLSGKKIVIVSTPTGRDSRIAKWFERSDKRRFFVDCLSCGKSSHLTFDNLHWTKGKPETAELACLHCGALHSEAQRAAMLESGRWVSTNPDGEKGIRGYHITALASEYSSLESLVRAWEACSTVEERQVFHNLKLGEPFDSSLELSMSSIELRERAEPIRPPYSRDIEFITAGVDVQDNRLEVQFVAHQPNGVTTILNHDRLDGDTFSGATWGKLDASLGQTFELADGRHLPVLVTAIDCGHRPDAVIDFVLAQARKSRQVVAVKGKEGWARPFIDRGGKLKKRLDIYIVGTDSVKAALYRRLQKLEFGPDHIHVPDHLPDGFYRGLASERIETVYVRGYARSRFVPNIRENEALDACVYAHAVAGLVNRKALVAQRAEPAQVGPNFKDLAANFAATIQSNR